MRCSGEDESNDRLDIKTQSVTLTLRPPQSRLEFDRVSALALHVLRQVKPVASAAK
jgi:hypothetical protein